MSFVSLYKYIRKNSPVLTTILKSIFHRKFHRLDELINFHKSCYEVCFAYTRYCWSGITFMTELAMYTFPQRYVNSLVLTVHGIPVPFSTAIVLKKDVLSFSTSIYRSGDIWINAFLKMAVNLLNKKKTILHPEEQ